MPRGSGCAAMRAGWRARCGGSRPKAGRPPWPPPGRPRRGRTTARRGGARDLDRLRAALPRDGALAGCDGALPARLVTHEWTEAQRARTERLCAAIGALAARLDDILNADFAASPEARSPERLRAGMGGTYQSAFDFDAMARLLARGHKAGGLVEGRRRRIAWLLGVLRGQRFAPLPGSGVAPYGFAFSRCAEALEAWRQRLPEAAEVARAIAMARLEVAGEYDESWHDGLFAAVGAEPQAPGPEFPDYLVCLGQDAAREDAALVLEAFAAGLPFKVLVQRDDLLLDGPPGVGVVLAADTLATAAVALGEVYVLQTGAAHLFGQRRRLRAGLTFAGPALFHVYSGAAPGTAGLSPYLVSAAAVESRAFPTFAFDPSAGPDWASRFALDGNPQPGLPWPLHPLQWEDAAHRRQDADGGVHHGGFPGLRPAGGEASGGGRAGGVERAAATGARGARACGRRGPRAGGVHGRRGRRALQGGGRRGAADARRGGARCAGGRCRSSAASAIRTRRAR